MEKHPTNNFISSNEALEGAGGLSHHEKAATNIDAPADASRDEVIDLFIQKQVELSDALSDVSERPGFNLDTHEIMDKRAEQSNADENLATFTEVWTQFGGDEILEAQRAVDSLSFKSDANERVAATSRLRDAKNTFFENYQASHNSAEADDENVNETETDENQPLIEIKRPAVKRYEERQARLDEKLDTDDAETVTFETEDTPLPGLESEASFEAQAEAQQLGAAALDLSGADLLSDSKVVAEYRAVKARRREQMNRIKAGFAANPSEVQRSGLLDDSEVVNQHLARKAKRRGLIRKAQGALLKQRFGSEMKKEGKRHKKEMAKFDKATNRERTLQDAEDKAHVESASREDALEAKLFDKRLKAEAKLKAKQDAKTERFNDRESRRLNRRMKLGRAAARTRMLVTR